VPDVFTDVDAKLYAAESVNRKLPAGREISEFVKDPVVRQKYLAIDIDDLPAGDNSGSIVNILIFPPVYKPYYGGYAVDLTAQFLYFGYVVGDELWLEDEVFRGISGHRQFRKNGYIGLAPFCPSDLFHDPCRITGNVTDHWIYLRKGQPQNPHILPLYT
jgi:hypothetical protein